MRTITLLILVLIITAVPSVCFCECGPVWSLMLENGELLSMVCIEPHPGDQYIAADNRLYEVTGVTDDKANVSFRGELTMPDVQWLHFDEAQAVSASRKYIAMYCTHSDESYLPSDGIFSSEGRGTIFEVAAVLKDALQEQGIHAKVSDNLHHPHDAGAYRRSRQTAVSMIQQELPDCLIDMHRDGIPDPASYAVTIGGEPVSRIRLLVGRGNQNAEVNKDFALMIKAVADSLYPGLIKDIYLGKGTYNQDLLPQSILLECGTYTLEKEKVFSSMQMMADVLDRALYGGIKGSAGRIYTDSKTETSDSGGIVQAQEDAAPASEGGVGYGFFYLIAVLLLVIIGLCCMSAGSIKGGLGKAARNLREMTGGLIGKRKEPGEDPEHSK